MRDWPWPEKNCRRNAFRRHPAVIMLDSIYRHLGAPVIHCGRKKARCHRHLIRHLRGRPYRRSVDGSHLNRYATLSQTTGMAIDILSKIL